MKNEIDELLEGLFRNGILSGKSGKQPAQSNSAYQPQEPPTPQLEWDPAEHAEKAQQALDAVQRTNDILSQSVMDSLEKLTQEAQADMAGLERRLQEDGVSHATAGNPVDAAALDSAFDQALAEAKEQVLGQEAFLNSLAIAFKRPFVAGTGEGPLGRVAVLGGKGTGRHTALRALAGSLGRQGVLKSPALASVDLSRYAAAGSEKLFVQDLYAALKSGACGLVFENFQDCHPSVLPYVTALFREGEAPLSGRYAEQKGMLVEIGSALVPGAVSSLSGAGKYLFLVTDKGEAKLADAFGMPFLDALDDRCATQPFSQEALRAIAEKELKELCKLLDDRLGYAFTYEGSAVDVLAAVPQLDQGAAALELETGKLYQALGERKLQEGLRDLSGTIAGREGRLAAVYEAQGEEVVLLPGDGGADEARAAAIQAVKAEMDEIVGLGEIKSYILSLEDNYQIQQLRREKGLKADLPSMHMIFTGNPGTGKTTVARLVSRYLKAIGVLAGGQLVEVTRADLVGQYVGHTAPLTQKAIQSALGGVLFIDEAYSLYRGDQDSFGLEAIDTLVKGMEDHRDQLIVILAGYSYEMEEFLTANSGLRSRFPNIIEFPDYTAQELLDITKSIVKGKGYRLDPSCDRPLLDYYDRQQREGDPRTNGNGRMARNKVEEAVLACSRRNMAAPADQRDLELLLPADFGLPA